MEASRDPVIDQRRCEMLEWLAAVLASRDFRIEPASGDASFRRYFRVYIGEATRIVMDAPPAKEDCRPFIDVARRLRAAGVHAPQILARDLEHGFLLLSDLGPVLYLDKLNEENADALYGDAIGSLVAMQREADPDGLPPYDEELLNREMALFRDWLLGVHLQYALSRDEHVMLDNAFARLAELALAQPTVFVHRDYHSRNLTWLPQHNPGVLDFQDAVAGPLTYDLVSLLRDCYIQWPPVRIRQWQGRYLDSARAAGLPVGAGLAQFERWFDWMGIQRHLKASGIFARLWHRDGKPGYLKDVPRTLGYIIDVCSRYDELTALGRFVSRQVLAKLEEQGPT